MIPEINKILFAADLSDSSRHAYYYAASLANRYGAKVTLLHVIEDIIAPDSIGLGTYLGGQKWEELQKRIEKEAIEILKERVDSFCREVASELEACPFITDEIVLKRGKPVEEIIREAGQRNSDLIIMGTQGLGGLAGTVMGSTARRVLRRSKIPVLVVRLSLDKK